MARKIVLLVANGYMTVIDTDTDTGVVNSQYNGGFGGVSFEVFNSGMLLTGADDLIALHLPNGQKTGFFKRSEIVSAEINGVDQLPTATDLAGIISAFSPYFFFEAPPYTLSLVSGASTINYANCGNADLVYLATSEASPTSWTISKITNLPAGRQITFMVKENETNVTGVTFDRVTYVNLTADGMLHGSSDPLIEPKNEFITVMGFNNGTYNVVATVALATSLV